MRSAPTMTLRKVSEFPSAMELLPHSLQWRTRNREIRCKRPPSSLSARTQAPLKWSKAPAMLQLQNSWCTEELLCQQSISREPAGSEMVRPPPFPPGCSARWHQADVSATARRGEIRRGVAPSMFEIDEPSPAHYEMIEPIACRD